MSQFLYNNTPTATNAVITPIAINTGALIAPIAPVAASTPVLTAANTPVRTLHPDVNIPATDETIPITVVIPTKAVPNATTAVITICTG